MNFTFSSLSSKLPRCLQTGLLILATGVGVSFNANDVIASEEVVLTYSAFDQPVLVEDLETFVETGKMSPAIRFLIGITKQDPEVIRKALTQEVGLNSRFVYKVFNSLPGEYVLFQAGQVVHPRFKPDRAIIPALRSTLILSASDDSKISLLEFFQKYPTKQMYIDGRLLKNTAEDVIDVVNNAEETLEVPLAIAKDFLAEMVCECEVADDNNPNDKTNLANIIQDSSLIKVEDISSQQ